MATYVVVPTALLSSTERRSRSLEASLRQIRARVVELAASVGEVEVDDAGAAALSREQLEREHADDGHGALAGAGDDADLSAVYVLDVDGRSRPLDMADAERELKAAGGAPVDMTRGVGDALSILEGAAREERERASHSLSGRADAEANDNEVAEAPTPSPASSSSTDRQPRKSPVATRAPATMAGKAPASAASASVAASGSAGGAPREARGQLQHLLQQLALVQARAGTLLRQRSVDRARLGDLARGFQAEQRSRDRVDKQIAALQAALADKDKALAAAEAEARRARELLDAESHETGTRAKATAELESRAADLQARLSAQEARAAEREEALQAAESAVAELTGELKKRDIQAELQEARIVSLQNVFDAVMTAKEQERSSEMTALNAKAQVTSQTVRDVEAQLAAKEASIHALATQLAQAQSALSLIDGAAVGGGGPPDAATWESIRAVARTARARVSLGGTPSVAVGAQPDATPGGGSVMHGHGASDTASGVPLAGLTAQSPAAPPPPPAGSGLASTPAPGSRRADATPGPQGYSEATATPLHVQRGVYVSTVAGVDSNGGGYGGGAAATAHLAAGGPGASGEATPGGASISSISTTASAGGKSRALRQQVVDFASSVLHELDSPAPHQHHGPAPQLSYDMSGSLSLGGSQGGPGWPASASATAPASVHSERSPGGGQATPALGASLDPGLDASAMLDSAARANAGGRPMGASKSASASHGGVSASHTSVHRSRKTKARRKGERQSTHSKRSAGGRRDVSGATASHHDGGGKGRARTQHSQGGATGTIVSAASAAAHAQGRAHVPPSLAAAVRSDSLPVLSPLSKAAPNAQPMPGSHASLQAPQPVSDGSSHGGDGAGTNLKPRPTRIPSFSRIGVPGPGASGAALGSGDAGVGGTSSRGAALR